MIIQQYERGDNIDHHTSQMQTKTVDNENDKTEKSTDNRVVSEQQECRSGVAYF